MKFFPAATPVQHANNGHQKNQEALERAASSIRAQRALYWSRSFGDYGDKRARNKRIGPGGGTRRLHQNPSFGDGRGRNRIDGRLKVLAFTRRDATVIGSNCIVANDNYAPVRVAA